MVTEEPQKENTPDIKKMNLNDNVDNSYNFNLNE